MFILFFSVLFFVHWLDHSLVSEKQYRLISLYNIEIHCVSMIFILELKSRTLLSWKYAKVRDSVYQSKITDVNLCSIFLEVVRIMKVPCKV